MTLLEVCDKVSASLIIKRLSMREGTSIKYTVNMQGVMCYDKERTEGRHTWYGLFPKKPLILNKDVNVAIQELCDKISNTRIESGVKTLDVGKVEKGNFCILGVW